MSTPTPPSGAVAPWKLWCVASILAGCDTWIDCGALPGLNWLWTTLSAVIAFGAIRAGTALAWRELTPLLIACALAGGAVVTANAPVLALLLLGVPASLAIGVSIAIGTENLEQRGARQLLLAPAIVLFAASGEALRRLSAGAGAVRAPQRLPVLRGVAFAAPVLLTFGLLLSAADPVLAAWRELAVQAFRDQSVLRRTLCFAGFAFMLLGTLGLASNPPALGAPAAARSPVPPRWVVGRTERMIVLGAVVALFALFLGLTASHLFGDRGGTPGTGVTYAQAAHQGFGELCLVASLCVALLLTLVASSDRPRLDPVERTLSALLVLETQLLLLSAVHRVSLYEEAYGFTEQRLAVQYYAGLVAVALAVLAAEILGSPDLKRLARRWTLAAGLALCGFVYWNHSAWIARQNLERYERTHTLDLRYLIVGLGADAVPEWTAFMARLPPAMQQRARDCFHSVDRPGRSDRTAHQSWYEWNYRRRLRDTALRTVGLDSAPPTPGPRATPAEACSG